MLAGLLGILLLPARLSAPVHEIIDAEESFLHLLHLLDGFPGWSLDAERHQRDRRDVPSVMPSAREGEALLRLTASVRQHKKACAKLRV